MGSVWRPAFDVVDKKLLPPDPDVLEAIGLSHRMTSAVADLVDNSIDAKAKHVLIRFVQMEGQLTSLLVFDDGRGMDDRGIDAAMTVGKRRVYDSQALGHFGMGLKAATFSQADNLTVLSRQAGSHAVGRQWHRRGARNFECDVLDPGQVEEELGSLPFDAEAYSGTMVRWDKVRTFPASADPRVTADYLARIMQELRAHLGLVLHRVLTQDPQDPTVITLDVLDASVLETGAPQMVETIDPFGYRQSGHRGYPKTFSCQVGGRALPVQAHIWPARSEALGFRLDGSPEHHQGFFFYRNDRLLEAGHWKGAAVASRRLQLARVVVDISDSLEFFSMSMEKNSVHPRPEFIRAVEHATADDGTSFQDFLAAAEETYRLGNQRNTGRKEVIPPGSGIAPEVKRAVEAELPQLDGRDPMQIRWKRLPGEDFFEVDRATHTLWLNTLYRKGLLAGRRAGLNDVPLTKALLYLIMENIFRGSAFGPRDKDNVEVWQAILTAAVRAETDEH